MPPHPADVYKRQVLQIPPLTCDLSIHLDRVTVDAVRRLDQLAPFGAENPTPVFLLQDLGQDGPVHGRFIHDQDLLLLLRQLLRVLGLSLRVGHYHGCLLYTSCWPISPSAAAPSTASITAWASTSASEWPSKPFSKGISTQMCIRDRGWGSQPRRGPADPDGARRPP